MNIVKQYEETYDELLEYFGLQEDWVVCPIDIKDEMFWYCDGKIVIYGETVNKIRNTDGEYYQDDVYTQRFYEKHVYEGKDYTLIFCNPHVDGMKWWRIFKNDKRIHNLDG